MTSQSILVLTVSTVVVVAVAGIGEHVVQRETVPNRVTITYWEKWTGSEGEEMRKTVNDFNRSQDKIFVQYLSISDVANKTLLAAAGGDPPDVAGLWSQQVAQFADGHALTDLLPLANSTGVKSGDYIKGYWDMMTYRGGLWALPSTPASTAMHVNSAIAPAGYNTEATFPRTFEEFDQVIRPIATKDKSGRLLQAGFMPSEPGWWHFAWGYWFGGSLMDGDRLTIDSPENEKAFDWIASFGQALGSQPMQDFQSGFGNFASPQDAFMDGKLVSELHGVYKANYINIYRPNMKWFAVPFLHPANRPDLAEHSCIGSDVLMIPNGSKHAQEAFEFIRYVQRQDVMESLCSRHGKNSPLAKVSDAFFATHPNHYIRLFDKLARSPSAFFEPKLGISAQLEDEMGNVFQEVNMGQQTPKQALQTAQTRLDGQWARYRQQVLDE